MVAVASSSPPQPANTINTITSHIHCFFIAFSCSWFSHARPGDHIYRFTSGRAGRAGSWLQARGRYSDI
jgi:hypothetical protein